MKIVYVATLALGLAACATGINPQKYNDAPFTPEEFTQCRGYGCTHKSETGFTKSEWRAITGIFSNNPATTAQAERGQIAGAIALMERITGAKTGTSEDLGAAGSIKESDKQLDCIDETVNTTQYLTMLQRAGMFKFYHVAAPTHRGYIIDARWPHNTAVIGEIGTGNLFVVDSFYRPNGEEPYIIPRQDWLNGWKPAGATQ